LPLDVLDLMNRILQRFVGIDGGSGVWWSDRTSLFLDLLPVQQFREAGDHRSGPTIEPHADSPGNDRNDRDHSEH
jgi:hypothetical protein